MKKLNLKKIFIFIVMIIVVLTLAGCMPGDGTNSAAQKAGFFSGVWHGWIAPVSLIFGLFDKDIRIYEINNSGWMYDFGYYIAVISGFGSLALGRRKKVVVKEQYSQD